MTDPEAAVRCLIDRYLRKAGFTSGGLGGPSDAALDALHQTVTAALGKDSALTQLETAVARLRMALHDATGANPRFARDLRVALAALGGGSGLPPGNYPGGSGAGSFGGGGPGPGGGAPLRPGGRGGGAGGQHEYAVEDVWVEDREHKEPPDSSGWSPRT